MIEQLLMSRIFRRYIEAWAIILAPWVLFTERKAVTMTDFALTLEEKQEMEKRRALWNEDDWRESPTGDEYYCLGCDDVFRSTADYSGEAVHRKCNEWAQLCGEEPE